MSDWPRPRMHLPRAKHVVFLSGLPNSQRAARNVFSHGRIVRMQRLVMFGVNGGWEKEMIDFGAWAGWIRSLDTAWVFLLILVLVVAVVVVWSSTLRPDNTKVPKDDEART